MMINTAVVGYLVAAMAFTVFLVILTTAWRRSGIGSLLLFAIFANVVWAGLSAYQALIGYSESLLLVSAELVRNGSWVFFLAALMAKVSRNGWRNRFLRIASGAAAGIIMLLAGILGYALVVGVAVPAILGFELRIVGNVLLALIGLMMIEHLFRSTPMAQRWSVKFLYVGLGFVFVFDFYLYTDALLLKQIDFDIWAARGFVNTMVVPLIAVSAARNLDWELEVFVSRSFVFRTTVLFLAGSYLLAMALGGYYVKLYGGSWGGVAQLTFSFGALVILLVALFSGQMRARLRVFLNKNFFNYRYDYREEWLKFIKTLGTEQQQAALKERVISAMAEVVESPAGMLWLRDEDNLYRLAAGWNMPDTLEYDNNENESLVRFLNSRKWVIDIDEYAQDPEIYAELVLPTWLGKPAWLIVPLLELNSVRGFLVLARSRAKMQINWEVRDLLITAGRQAANYIALYEANEALIDARQFEAFNRLSAYVVHDLKNVVAQLSLVASNALKHKDKPEFVDDVVHTVENAAQKIGRMLEQLRKGRVEISNDTQIHIESVLQQVVEQRKKDWPVPVFVSQCSQLRLVLDADRFENVIAHLVQNAQEATADDGKVEVRLQENDGYVVIEIVDTGCGMSERFIRERLFKPFHTTKGNAGMGIGVYESREFFRSIGGSVRVESQPGKGTVFRIRLKLIPELKASIPHLIGEQLVPK
jgi:putative PEP-CTERM system histidine kinase